MKYRSLPNWAHSDDIEGLLFFVQRLDELLFDYTDDSYKPKALNSPSLCDEALGLFKYIENESVNKNITHPILEELKWSLTNDIVAKQLMSIDVDHYINHDFSPKKQKIRLELIYEKIEPVKYLLKTQSLIISAIKKPKEKKKLNRLANIYITNLINVGYHHNYIYSQLENFFFDTRQISSPEDIIDFLNIFDLNINKYTVFIRAAKIFLNTSNCCDKFGVNIIDISKQETPDDKFFREDPKKIYLQANVENYDMYSAREHAEYLIDLLSNTFSWYHHKARKYWDSFAFVWDEATENGHCLNTPVSPTKRVSDYRPGAAATQLDKMLNELIFNKDSLEIFFRVYGLHRTAVESESFENQLLNLWMSLETLTPVNKNQSIINNIINTIIPFLKSNYIFNKLDRLNKDLEHWNHDYFNDILDSIEMLDHDDVEKLALILTSQDYEKLKTDLFKELDNFYLLRFRCHEISEIITKTTTILKAIKEHEKKIIWQIYRIYRTRNLIIHTSIKPQYLNNLIENAHSYLDTVINQIMYLNFNHNIQSIPRAIAYAEIKMGAYESFLRNHKIDLSKDNINKLINPFL